MMNLENAVSATVDCRVSGLMAHKVKMARILDPTIKAALACKTKVDQDKCVAALREIRSRSTSMKYFKATKSFEVTVMGVGQSLVESIIEKIRATTGANFEVAFSSNTRKWLGVTLLWVPEAFVLGLREYESRRAVQLGVVECKPSAIAKPQRVECEKLGAPHLKLRREFELIEGGLSVGDKLAVTQVFNLGDMVSITGKTIGRGTSGVMKRWNFGGGPASHGTSLAHRKPGSTGSRKANRTFKNKKMPGCYGNEQVTVQGLQILDVDPVNQILVVRGSVPGKNGWVNVESMR
jgi:large subunit ribosomal protein L3